MARVQKAEAMKESALLERKAKADMKRKLNQMSDTVDLRASAPGRFRMFLLCLGQQIRCWEAWDRQQFMLCAAW